MHGDGPPRARDRWVSLAWLGGVLAIAYAPMWTGSVLYFRDLFRQTYPMRLGMRELVWRGELPVWNPDLALGMSAFANPLWGHFYPPNWLYLVGPLPWMITFVHFLHVFWGGWGAVALARRFGARGTVAGVVWALSGYVSSSLTVGLAETVSWLPWFGVGFIALAEAQSNGARSRVLRGLAAAALPVALEGLHGEPFFMLIGSGFGMGMGLAWLWQDRTPVGDRRRVLVRFLVAACLASALGAVTASVTLWPAALSSGQTERGAPLPLALAEERSLSPGRLIELVAPWALGDPYVNYPGARLLGFGPDYRPLLYSVYAGAAAVALALLAYGRGRPAALPLALIAAAGLGLALGRYLPLHRGLRVLVPPLAYMRHPEKYLGIVQAMLAVLAALGADRLLEGGTSRVPWRRTVLLALGLLLVGVTSVVTFEPLLARTMVRGAAAGIAAVLGVLVCQLLAARGLRAAAPLLVVVLGLDLLLPTVKLNEMTLPEVMTTSPRAAVALARTESRPPGTGMSRLYRSRAVDESVGRFIVARSLAEVERREIETLTENTSLPFGLAPLEAYELVPSSVGILQKWAPDRLAALRLLGVEYALLPVSDPREPPGSRPGLTAVIDPLPGARLYRVDASLPRAYLAERGEVLADEAARTRVFSDEVLRGEAVVLAPGVGVEGRDVPGAIPGTCQLDEIVNGRLRATCTAERAAYAVFVEQYADGWSATVDGRPAPLLRANVTARAVPVPAGRHTIAMDFRVPGLPAGAALTLLGAALLLLLWLAPRLPWATRAQASQPGGTGQGACSTV